MKESYTGYDIANQWASYGWNTKTIPNGNDFDQVFAALKAMEDTASDDRRPMILIGDTVKGWWPAAENGELPGYGPIIDSYQSHPYAIAMNSEYFIALAETYEKKYGVEFEGIRDGKPPSASKRSTRQPST